MEEDAGAIVAEPSPRDDAGLENDASADAEDASSTDASEASATDAAAEGGADVSQPPADSGTSADSSSPADSGADAADAGPCVTSVEVPTSPNWVIWARYTLSATTSQSVPYYCPDGVTGNSCKYALGNPASGYVYPAPGACRIAVPDKCLPCTNGVTEW